MAQPAWSVQKTRNRLQQYRCGICRSYTEPDAPRALCSFHSKFVSATQVVCLDGRMREKREDQPVNATGKNNNDKIQRVMRRCSCGFESDWPAAWAKHDKSCTGHEVVRRCIVCRERLAPADVDYCAQHADLKPIDATGIDPERLHPRTDTVDPEPSVDEPVCDLPCSVDPCDGTDCTRDDDDEDSEPEKCEGCSAPATTQDIEGVPLCAKCMRDTIEDNLRDDLRILGIGEETIDRMIAAADIAAVDPIARQITEDTLEASDVAATIAEAARLDGGRITLADLAAEGIGIRLTPKDPERALRAELIDTHLRLVISQLQASLGVVPASLVCSLQDRIERVQELVEQVAS